MAHNDDNVTGWLSALRKVQSGAGELMVPTLLAWLPLPLELWSPLEPELELELDFQRQVSLD